MSYESSLKRDANLKDTAYGEVLRIVFFCELYVVRFNYIPVSVNVPKLSGIPGLI